MRLLLRCKQSDEMRDEAGFKRERERVRGTYSLGSFLPFLSPSSTLPSLPPYLTHLLQDGKEGKIGLYGCMGWKGSRGNKRHNGVAGLRVSVRRLKVVYGVPPQ